MDNSPNEIFDAIKSGHAKMRPKWYFALLRTFEALALIVLIVLLIYIAVFIIVILHQTGAWFAVDFGFGGWYTFVWSLPWLSILLLILCLLLSAGLMKRYAFVYKRPLLYAVLGVVTLVALGTFLITATPFSPRLFTNYSMPGTSLFGGFYQYEAQPPSGVHRGQIVVLANNGFIMKNAIGVTTTVLFVPGLVFPNAANLQLGDVVVVLGSRDANGVIQAFGVEKIAE